MSNPFDDLEAQLREAVQRHAPISAPRRWRRSAALIVAAGLAVSGAAWAAVHLASGGTGGQSHGRSIAFEAVRQTAGRAPCRPPAPAHGVDLSDATPLPAITDALPDLARPPRPAGEHAARRYLTPGESARGPVLRSTLRLIELAPKLRLVVYVQQGAGLVSDPARCLRLRLDRAAQIAAHAAPDVRQWARTRLMEMRDTTIGLQMLWVKVVQNAGPGAGTGIPVSPGQPLPTGLIFSASASSDPARHGESLYIGIAEPSTRHILVEGPRRRIGGLPHRIGVTSGFFGLMLPPHTGPVTLREVGPAGRAARVIKLRERPHHHPHRHRPGS